jgi:Cu(I)/Ag(I) efflux system membrane fusion protein
MPSGIKGMAEVTIPAERRQAIGVRTETVTRRPLAHTIRTVGVVAADERRVRKVQTKISGWVQQLFVNFTGEHVDTGQPILSIYSPELGAAQREYLLALQANRGGAPGSEPSGAEARRLMLEAARDRLLFWDLSPAQLEALKRSGNPERTVTLHSPISGYVTIKPVYGGMYVTPEMELYTVTELSTVWIWADVYEREVELVRPGQEATITLASAPGSTRPAVVRYVNPTMEPVTRTLRVRFDVDNRDGHLKPGMYATVELEVPLGDVLALPEDAVIDTGERKITFVAVDEGRFQPRELRLGRKGERYYEVLDGLADGDRVVVSAQFLLDSESRLRATSGAGGGHAGH